MPTIDSQPGDRFQPGDVVVFQQSRPGNDTPMRNEKNGWLATVIGRYDRFSYKGDSEAYQLEFENGMKNAYFTKMCKLAAPVKIIGDDDSDCI